MLELTDGKRVYVETWLGSKWSYLKPLEDWEKKEFGDSANYRLPSGNLVGVESLVLVEVTGRTVQLKHGQSMVKGKITWQDGQTSPCWLAVYDDLKPHEMW